MYTNLFTSGSISAGRAAERFFAEYFDFLLDNISRYYLVFTFFFLTLLVLHLSLIVLANGLE